MDKFSATPSALTIMRKVPIPASFSEDLPRGYQLENAKENEFIAAKFRIGNAYENDKLYEVDSNHIAIGRITHNREAEFYANITTHKSTILRGKPATLNIPFSHMDTNGNYTFKWLDNPGVFRILNRDPDRDEKLLYCQMMGYKKIITQFIYPWDHILIPTSRDVYQKCTTEQHVVLKKLMIENKEILEFYFSHISRATKPRAFYNKNSAPEYNKGLLNEDEIKN